jgi:hypothetical protein
MSLTEDDEASDLPRIARLLPWSGPEGKPCYVLTDDRGGTVSRLADTMESIQLGMGAELLGHAHELLPDTPRGNSVSSRSAWRRPLVMRYGWPKAEGSG